MIEFVIIVESDADFRTASTIANRVLLERIDWLEEFLLPQLLRWSGLQANTDFSCWQDIRLIEDELRRGGIHLPRFRSASDPPLKIDGAAAQKVLRMVSQLQKANQRQIKAIVFIRDLDNQPEHRQSLEQVRLAHSEIVTVIGTVNGKREAWVLNGFVSIDKTEETLLTELQKQLGFDPVLEAHRLRAATFAEPDRARNVKVVLAKLTNDDHERESQCWQDTALDILRSRGVHTGLTEYMKEVEERLVPVLQQG